MADAHKKKFVEVVEDFNDVFGEWVLGDHHISTTKLWGDSKKEFAVFYKQDLVDLIYSLTDKALHESKDDNNVKEVKE
jgi:hypothetical protein